MAINRDDWLRSITPAGTVIAFAGATPPSGWLLCDGSAISRSTYSALFEAISTAHGSGDGLTTFHLPDYRGRFLRGVANGSANDPDRATRTHPVTGAVVGDVVGSVQEDAMQGHKHMTVGGSGQNNAADFNSTFGGTTTTLGAMGAFSSIGTYRSIYSGAANVSDNVNGNPRNSAESRPKNANINYIIKV